MRRWILTVGLVTAAPAFAQGEGEAAPAAPAAAEAGAPAAPAAAPAPAVEAPAPPKSAAPEKKAEAEATPAGSEAAPALAPADARPARATTAPASGSSTGLDVRPAGAKTRAKPAAAAAPAAAQAESAEEEPGPVAPPGRLSSPPPGMKPGVLPPPKPPLSAEDQERYQKDVEKMLGEMQQRADASPESAVQAPLTPKQLVEINARAFFFSLMSGDARSIATFAALPFTLEDQRLTHPDEVFDVWLKHLRSKRTDLLVLYGIEVLTPKEMEEKYGKPPARLASFPWKQGTTYVAIGNLSGRPAIALFRETRPSEFYLVGYTD